MLPLCSVPNFLSILRKGEKFTQKLPHLDDAHWPNFCSFPVMFSGLQAEVEVSTLTFRKGGQVREKIGISPTKIRGFNKKWGFNQQIDS